jgi:tetratricopeptide (TPR) repeat protein
LGALAQDTGEYDEARQLYQQSLKILQELGDKSGVSSSLHNLGMLSQYTGEYDEARKLYQQSLEIKQELDDKSGMSRNWATRAALPFPGRNWHCWKSRWEMRKRLCSLFARLKRLSWNLVAPTQS